MQRQRAEKIEEAVVCISYGPESTITKAAIHLVRPSATIGAMEWGPCRCSALCRDIRPKHSSVHDPIDRRTTDAL